MAEGDTPTNEYDLTLKQVTFADALLAGANLGIAAKTAGISPRTSVRWNQDPQIKAYIRRARSQAYNETLQTLMAGAATPLRVLLEAMTDKEAPHSVKIRAAQVWLDHAHQVDMKQSLEQEVRELRIDIERRDDL